MFRLQLAWRPVVVLNGLAAVQEAWVNGLQCPSMNTWALGQIPKANICGAQLSSLEDKEAVTKGRIGTNGCGDVTK
jgi:hypothetical protein